jgi:hypothetical protein
VDRAPAPRAPPPHPHGSINILERDFFSTATAAPSEPQSHPTGPAPPRPRPRPQPDPGSTRPGPVPAPPTPFPPGPVCQYTHCISPKVLRLSRKVDECYALAPCARYRYLTRPPAPRRRVPRLPAMAHRRAVLRLERLHDRWQGVIANTRSPDAVSDEASPRVVCEYEKKRKGCITKDSKSNRRQKRPSATNREWRHQLAKAISRINSS